MRSPTITGRKSSLVWQHESRSNNLATRASNVSYRPTQWNVLDLVTAICHHLSCVILLGVISVTI